MEKYRTCRLHVRVSVIVEEISLEIILILNTNSKYVYTNYSKGTPPEKRMFSFGQLVHLFRPSKLYIYIVFLATLVAVDFTLVSK